MKKPVVFLDRDGVLTVEKGYILPLEEVECYPFVKKCIEEIHQKGYLAIVVTNQGAVARGYFTEEKLIYLHEQIKREINVDAIYYCPHHKEGKVEKYAVDCNCRKPKLGMIEQACNQFEIDMENSYMVGDRASDIELGKNAGVKTILVESGYGSKKMEYDIQADFTVEDLREAVKIIENRQ
ncbi:MAG: HAD family hydrolase [Lachnospiraceae bacterium]|nr:HAD family hydrolase [Lachnospiraceae bacterium]